MKTVMAQGVFNLLHPGHLHYLEKSAELGDELVVVIARDSRIDKDLLFTEEERRIIIDSLETVDRAILGSEDNIYSTVEDISPDIITIGPDQDHSVEKVEEKANKVVNGEVEVEKIESNKDYSSSDLKENF